MEKLKRGDIVQYKQTFTFHTEERVVEGVGVLVESIKYESKFNTRHYYVVPLWGTLMRGVGASPTMPLPHVLLTVADMAKYEEQLSHGALQQVELILSETKNSSDEHGFYELFFYDLDNNMYSEMFTITDNTVVDDYDERYGKSAESSNTFKRGDLVHYNNGDAEGIGMVVDNLEKGYLSYIIPVQGSFEYSATPFVPTPHLAGDAHHLCKVDDIITDEQNAVIEKLLKITEHLVDENGDYSRNRTKIDYTYLFELSKRINRFVVRVKYELIPGDEAADNTPYSKERLPQRGDIVKYEVSSNGAIGVGMIVDTMESTLMSSYVIPLWGGFEYSADEKIPAPHVIVYLKHIKPYLSELSRREYRLVAKMLRETEYLVDENGYDTKEETTNDFTDLFEIKHDIVIRQLDSPIAQQVKTLDQNKYERGDIVRYIDTVVGKGVGVVYSTDSGTYIVPVSGAVNHFPSNKVPFPHVSLKHIELVEPYKLTSELFQADIAKYLSDVFETLWSEGYNTLSYFTIDGTDIREIATIGYENETNGVQ